LLAQAGQSRVALSGAALMSAGGVLGDLAFGALSLRWRAATVGRLFAVACFGSAATLGIIASLGGGIVIPAFLLGFFLYGTMACHYAVVPAVYPGAMRASGTGLAVGMGRVGAAIGPMLGGILLSMDMPVSLVTAAMTMPVLICAVLIALLGRAPRPSRP
jgi:AAHS family 3-hydroxyphenylpropionic acid transporter